LVKPETLKALLDGHNGALCSVLTAHITDEEAKTSGYGRIIRDHNGNVRHIVEVAGACEEQLKVTEVNTGVYAFDAAWLYKEVVPNLKAHPPKNEYYLTDAIEVAAKAASLNAVVHGDLDEVTGINDRVALADATKTALQRICDHWMMEGVTIESPDNTWIDAGVSIGPETVLETGVVLKGSTVIGEGVVVGAHSRLQDTTVAAGATIGAGTVSTGATIGANASAGPMARLRPGAVLKADAKVGNFVEVKNSEIGVGAKVSHLSYIGDASIGEGANVGAGTITCNYDGYNKHKTEIKAGAFIGSNTSLVAPVVVGEGAIVAAGSTITEDVADNALALGRARQSEKLGAATKINSANKAKKESDNQ
jgi:bifunctional UDP-N-acetylglucosamine pyrophosphorylase/glucosamine-1-phosphate N-acetyltransferase